MQASVAISCRALLCQKKARRIFLEFSAIYLLCACLKTPERVASALISGMQSVSCKHFSDQVQLLTVLFVKVPLPERLQTRVELALCTYSAVRQRLSRCRDPKGSQIVRQWYSVPLLTALHGLMITVRGWLPVDAPVKTSFGVRVVFLDT
jgi:hypothetical protein